MQTDELKSLDINPYDGTIICAGDADISEKTEPNHCILQQRSSDETRKLDLQMLEALRAEAELQWQHNHEVTQVTGPLHACIQHEPPPMAPARWFDERDTGVQLRPEPPPRMDGARTHAHSEPAVRPGKPPIRHLQAQVEVAIVNMARRYPGWGMIRVTNALRREGVDVHVKEVAKVLGRYGVLSPVERVTLRQKLARKTSHARASRRFLLGFEVLAFATLTVAVGMAWFAI